MRIARALCLLSLAGILSGQTAETARLLAKVTASAEGFQREARNLLSTETLVQRCYRIPEHPHFAIGRAAEPLYAQVIRHDVESEYRIDSLPSDRSGNLVEIRAALKKDGRALQTKASALAALRLDGPQGDARALRKLLTVFTDLGLVDVATNYGPMILLFTRAGMGELEMEPVGPRYFGAEDAFVFRWRQRRGGLLELRKGNTVRRPLNGELWVRVSDGMPLRITAGAETVEAKHRIGDYATVELTVSAAVVTPLLAVHRHFVDGQFLAENFFSYEPFRRFQVESEIQYSAPGK